MLAINYGSRTEVRRAVHQLVMKAHHGLLKPADISCDTISEHLWTAAAPNPVLLFELEASIDYQTL